MQQTIGDSPRKMLAKAEVKMKCVCTNCNHGWMSMLEQENIPVLGLLVQDVGLPLDNQQQAAITRWALKTAMVVEAVRTQSERYFTQAERMDLREQSVIPSQTTVWLGRYISTSIGAFGTDLGFNMDDGKSAGVGCATTIIAGHAAIQILALRPSSQLVGKRLIVNSRPGRWEKQLVEIWPGTGKKVHWPPPLAFANSGPVSIAHLMDRWRVGTKVSKLQR